MIQNDMCNNATPMTRKEGKKKVTIYVFKSLDYGNIIILTGSSLEECTSFHFEGLGTCCKSHTKGPVRTK